MNSAIRQIKFMKIHKKDFPVRIIVLAVNSPFYSFDKCISNFLNKYVPKPEHYLKNSIELKNILENTFIPADYQLVYFGVVSLFTNLSKDSILKALKSK